MPTTFTPTATGTTLTPEQVTTLEQAFVGGEITGQVLTLARADGSVLDLDLPTTGGTGTADGVVTSAAVDATTNVVTLTTSTNATVTFDLTVLLIARVDTAGALPNARDNSVTLGCRQDDCPLLPSVRLASPMPDLVITYTFRSPCAYCSNVVQEGRAVLPSLRPPGPRHLHRRGECYACFLVVCLDCLPRRPVPGPRRLPDPAAGVRVRLDLSSLGSHYRSPCNPVDVSGGDRYHRFRKACPPFPCSGHS